MPSISNLVCHINISRQIEIKCFAIAVFNHGFAEATDRYTLAVGKETHDVLDVSADTSSDTTISNRHFEDSDTEDEETLAETDLDMESHITDDISSNFSNVVAQSSLTQLPNMSTEMLPSAIEMSGTLEDLNREDAMPVDQNENQAPRDPAGSSIQSSPLSNPITLDAEGTPTLPPEPEDVGPKKVKVVVKDIAYATYRAVLYYVSVFSHSLESC